jgi:hypothetical protein
MYDQSPNENGRRISEYVSQIRSGRIVTRKISEDARKFFGYSQHSATELLVADRKLHSKIENDAIANTSLDISYDVSKKLADAKSARTEVTFNNERFTIETKAEQSFYGYLFQEGAFHIYIHPHPPNGHNQYDVQLNFREIDVEGVPKRAVIVESIHKGVGEEFHLRQMMRRAGGGKEDESALGEEDARDLKMIKDTNAHMGKIEKEMGCSMSEMAFQTALAFSRGMNADIFMATDDAYVSTKQHYDEKGTSKNYAPNNWIYKKNGLLPPQQGEYYWINPYPNRLDAGNTSLQDSLFFYSNTAVTPPDRYRDFPKGISKPVVEKILVPFENNIRSAFRKTL